MNKLKVVRSLVSLLMVILASNFCTGLSSAQTKKVFAHYMMCNRDYGGSVSGYENDIKDAIGVGVDGFALNIGAWTEGNYSVDTASMFQAAANVNSQLGTSFKLFISADLTDNLSSGDIVSIMQTYANNANYFKYNNRPVLSTFGGQQKGGGGTGARDWWNNNVLTPLRTGSSINVFFVPHFYSNSETPSLATITSEYNTWWNGVVDGMFYFGAAGLPSATSPSIITSGEAYASLMHSKSKPYMATVSPQYWGSKQSGRRYYEYEGGIGLIRQWQSIIQTQQPEWVELVTWNDFDEASHFTPMGDVNSYWPYLQDTSANFYKKRIGIAKLNQYYIDWYKNYTPTTTPPPPNYVDNVYYMYRTHPNTAVASPADPHGTVDYKNGTVQDKIYITTILMNAAQLVVNSGGTITTLNLSAGIYTNSVDFHPGAQSFTLKRGGVSVCSGSGDSISSSISKYNFAYTSGWLHG